MASAVKFKNIVSNVQHQPHIYRRRTTTIDFVLPRRTTRQGVRPVLTSNPKKDANWVFPAEKNHRRAGESDCCQDDPNSNGDDDKHAPL